MDDLLRLNRAGVHIPATITADKVSRLVAAGLPAAGAATDPTKGAADSIKK